MDADLKQYVDMTVPEADGLKGYTKTTDDGKHYVPHKAAEGTCELCPDEDELRETDDGVAVTSQIVYHPAGDKHTTPLCRYHLAEQPMTIGLESKGGGQ
jgi:hypothetical protein